MDGIIKALKLEDDANIVQVAMVYASIGFIIRSIL